MSLNDARLAALALALGLYRFTRYRKAEARAIKLDLPQSLDRDDLARIVDAVTLARDLINTPANDMGPAQLEQAARKLAARHAATINAVVGEELLERNFPLIHAVGRAATAAPRLIDMTWGDANHPRVTLVGKGVCFDTGGLDIKPETGMLNMKKDMGGAATALALASMIMARGLKIRLRVLIPAVENSIAGASFRPRDIYTSRKGITVEIGNTDAEGRLVLADALALADEDKPELIADFATLTGAARVALGPDLPAFFTDDDALAAELMRHGLAENDPLWRLPLWRPYEAMLESKVADINNVGGSQGGAITAALFMRRFVTAKSWLHVDLFAWTAAAKAGRPEGGELQAATRALRHARGALRLSRQRCATSTLASPRSAPISPPNFSKARCRLSVTSTAATYEVDRRRRRRCDTNRAPMRRSIPKRSRANASRSTTRTTKAGPGASSPPTIMSAGCRRRRWRRPAPRRRTRSQACAHSRFPDRR